MKYVIVLGDGMADYPVPALNGKTPLMVARKQHIDALAARAEVGLMQTVPNGMKPGSDVANLSVLGYDPASCYTGRSPLEAVSMGISLRDTDVTLRCNLVTLSDDEPYEKKRMLDYSAGEISTAEAAELIAALKQAFDGEGRTLYAGISYRHCLVLANGKADRELTPPHDIPDREIGPYLPKGADELTLLMRRSNAILNAHPVNLKRIAEGKPPANSVWFWGAGTKPALAPFAAMYGVNAGVISAVDLVRGIGRLAGMRLLPVSGITGNWDTNFRGKAEAAIQALKDGLDLVYIHMEAPDECGHHGDVEKKIYSIEQIDREVVARLEAELPALGDYTLLLCPDHPTPIVCRTHVSDPVPYLLYRSNRPYASPATAYDEEQAKRSGIRIEHGHTMMRRLLQGN